MKNCKRFFAAVLIAAMLLLCVPAFSAAPAMPEAPEGYDGYIVFGASALTMGWGYIFTPRLVPVHEGETFAAVTARVFTENEREFTYFGTVEEGFYLNGIGCDETVPAVPEYLMNEMLAYPAWADEQFGYNFGEWTGTFTDDGVLCAAEYCGMSGWMFLEDNVTPSTGADATPVKIGSVYEWFFSIYGWGMDYGVSDGWGSFPLFDNPMEGVDRSEAVALLAYVNSDDELIDYAAENASDELSALIEALDNVESTQEEIDAAAAALRDALCDGCEAGDVNFDGSVNSEDALLVMRHSMGVFELTARACLNADVNEDGEINLADALLILRAGIE